MTAFWDLGICDTSAAQPFGSAVAAGLARLSNYRAFLAKQCIPSAAGAAVGLKTMLGSWVWTVQPYIARAQPIKTPD